MAQQPSSLTGFAADVLAWGVPRLRDLPWRRTRDPWAVLVSEVMLQQTQVGRVAPRWERFLERFPDADTCADATLGDVLREWQGLGYPRRARNLHETACRVSEAGEFPRDLEGLLALPGVGPYTARAVMVFAFELDAAVADTNIARVYARVMGERLTPKRLQAIADEHCPPGDAWRWNQCLMDLGAVLCRPVDPSCHECPVVASCAWSVSRQANCDQSIPGGDSDSGGAKLPIPLSPWHNSQLADPAVGSSGVSGKQARFEGSDRQARGRLMKALPQGPVRRSDVAEVMRRDKTIAAGLVDDLIGEGLCEPIADSLRLPG